MSNKKPFTLTTEEKQSPLWRGLLAHWEDRLAQLRTQNDGAKTEAETANLRGRIAQVKADIAMNNDLPDLDSTSPR